MWHACYQTADGKLLSVGSVLAAELPPGVSVLNLDQPPDVQATMWDTASRTFVARPPKVLADRLNDLLTNPNFAEFQTVYNALSASRKTQLRNALIRLLGAYRYRAQSEAVEL